MLAQIPGARETEVPAVLGVGGSGWRSICGGLASLPGPGVPPAARNPWPDPITVPQARQHDCGRRGTRRRFVHDPRGIAAIRASSPSQRSFSRQKARRTGRGAGADTSPISKQGVSVAIRAARPRWTPAPAPRFPSARPWCCAWRWHVLPLPGWPPGPAAKSGTYGERDRR